MAAAECKQEASENLILFCMDDSEHSLRAFHWYYKHFHRQEHVIGLVHIYALPEKLGVSKRHGADNPLECLENEDYQKHVDEVMKKRAGVLHKYQELCTERNIKSCVFSKEKKESIGQVICNIAQDNHAMCIVMGQRGLGAIKRTIFGSVSEYVLHHAHTTVLIVPPPKEHK